MQYYCLKNKDKIYISILNTSKMFATKKNLKSVCLVNSIKKHIVIFTLTKYYKNRYEQLLLYECLI